MRGLKSLLLAEQKRLEEIIKSTKNQLINRPEGTLRISKSKNYLQYYHCTEKNKLGKYIAKGNEELIHALAQKTYDEKILQLVEKRILQINRKRLILTYETEKNVLNTEKITQMVERYL